MSSSGTIVAHPVITGLTDAVAALDPAATGTAWQLSDAEVETGLATVLALQSRVTAVEAALLGQAQLRDLPAGTRASSLPRWLGDRFRLSRVDASARDRAAQALGRHPAVLEALGAGTLTAEQAGVVAAALDRMDALPDIQAADRAAAARFLLAQCGALTPRDLARAGQAVLEALTVAPSTDDPADADAVARDEARAEADAQAAERNDVTVTRRRGRVRAILDLGPVGAATLEAWLRRVDKPVAGRDGFEDTRSRSERRGDALVDLLAAAAAGIPTMLGDDTAPPDALPGLDATQIGAGLAPISPTALLTVTTTLAELRAGLAGAGRLETGDTLSAAALRLMACDALVVPAVLGEPSEVLDLGRASREWNRAQRRAVALRDRGCVAPGCDRPPSACQVHHSWWWSCGGPTDMCNAALLCGFHHRMVHRQGWAMGLASNGYPHLIPPTSIDPEQRPRQHHRFLIPDQQDRTRLTGRHRT